MKNDGVLHQQVLHAISENILVYYDIVPLQFKSRKGVVLSLWRRDCSRMDSYRMVRWMFQNSHCQRHKRYVTAAAVWLLALSWRTIWFSTNKCFTQYLKTFLCTTTSCHFNLNPGKGWFFHFGEEIVVAWTHIGWYGGCSRNSHCQRHKSYVTVAAVLLLYTLMKYEGGSEPTSASRNI